MLKQSVGASLSTRLLGFGRLAIAEAFSDFISIVFLQCTYLSKTLLE